MAVPSLVFKQPEIPRVPTRPPLLLQLRSTANGTFPREERFGLTAHLRKSATSIPSNIAEGCGREGERELARFLSIAAGSASESEYQLLLARDLGYLQPDVHRPLDDQVNEVKRMLNVFSVIVSLGIGDVSTPLECIGWHSYRSRLLFYIAFPFVLAALFLLFAAWHLRYVMGKRFSPVALMQVATPSLLKLAFIMYPLCTNTAFEAFPCHQLIREGEQREKYLKADV